MQTAPVPTSAAALSAPLAIDSHFVVWTGALVRWLRQNVAAEYVGTHLGNITRAEAGRLHYIARHGSGPLN